MTRSIHASPFPLVLALVLLAVAPPVAAQSITFDIPDGDVAGLVAAIEAANGTADADIINLADGGTYELTAVNNTSFYGDTGLPIIASPITVHGHGATIRRSSAGMPDFRIFLVANGPSSLTLDELTIWGGTTTAYGGGGLLNTGSAQLVRCTVADNSGDVGGGILNYCGTLTVLNSTITHNTGYSGYGGGGILNLSSSCASTVTIVSSTIFENRADGLAPGRGDAIADAFSVAGSIAVKNSILASPAGGLGSDLYVAAGVVTSLGHNIVGDGSGALAGPGDLNFTDPLLGPLADNGGSTWTYAPIPGSPAIDALSLADCTDTSGAVIATDQRGVARPQGVACDIGSVEWNDPAPPSQPAEPECWPFVVEIQELNAGIWQHKGSGVAIGQDWVMTAGQIMNLSAASIRIVAYDADCVPSYHPIDYYTKHEAFVDSSEYCYQNGIAVAHTTAPLPATVTPVGWMITPVAAGTDGIILSAKGTCLEKSDVTFGGFCTDILGNFTSSREFSPHAGEPGSPIVVEDASGCSILAGFANVPGEGQAVGAFWAWIEANTGLQSGPPWCQPASCGDCINSINSINLGTGQTGGVADAIGAVDSHWSLVFGPNQPQVGGPYNVMSMSPVPSWAVMPNVNWIGEGWSASTGAYRYVITFDLDVPANPVLNLLVSTDNSGIFRLNGNVIGTTGPTAYASTTAINVNNPALFIDNINTLTVDVVNNGTVTNPVGLLVSGNVTWTGCPPDPQTPAALMHGPIPYVSITDSPFFGLGNELHLEDFEDGLFNVAGVMAVNNYPGGSALGVFGPGSYTDSVDFDDGVIDGSGNGGHTFGPLGNDGGESFGITFTFDSAVLGGLPTHAGIVWVDGSPTAPTLFEAFGPGGAGDPLGSIGPVDIGDDVFQGTTADDNFFGVENASGISAIRISDPDGINTIELDHLQFGGLPGQPQPFKNLGCGLPGSVGVPQLVGSGTLVAGSAGSLDLTHMAPSAPWLLAISLESVATPFKGGTFVPVPMSFSMALTTSPTGTFVVSWSSWPAGLSGQNLFVQGAVLDAAAVHGVALTNALKLFVP